MGLVYIQHVGVRARLAGFAAACLPVPLAVDRRFSLICQDIKVKVHVYSVVFVLAAPLLSLLKTPNDALHATVKNSKCQDGPR